MRRVLTVSLASVIFAVLPPTAEARPGCGQARAAIAQVFGLLPDAMEGKLWLGDCYKRGRHSVSVDTRIIGSHPARYRAVVTLAPGEAYHVTVRPK